jgi:hypothetical protein
MGGIYYGVTLYLMWLLIGWCKANDGKAQTSGIFQIKPSAPLQRHHLKTRKSVP